MRRTAWMTGSLLGAAMLLSGAAVAQTRLQPGYDAQQTDEGARDDEENLAGPDEQDATPAKPSRAEEDFSDVMGSDEPAQTAREEARAPAAVPNPEDGAPDAVPTEEDREAITMSDACALAARDEAERGGGYAEVRQMESPRENRNGFLIDGDVEARSGWRAQDGQMRHFTCTVANGRIENVYFQRERAAR